METAIKKTSAEIRKDIKQEIIDQVLILMDTNKTVPWIKPWYMPESRNIMGTSPYRGINIWTTSLAPSPFFITLRYAKSIGMELIDPENALFYPIVHYSPTFKFKDKWLKEDDYKTLSKDDQRNCQVGRFLQYYKVYCIADFKPETMPEIIKKRLRKYENKQYNPRMKDAEALIKKVNPVIKQDTRAYYRPLSDFIGMPDISTFKDSESYYTTLFHELAHWTGAKSRLNREGITKINLFDDHKYSVEELIAEFSASQIAYNLGINIHFDNQTAYIASWITHLKNDPDMLFIASKKAEKVIEYLDKLALAA